MRMLISYDLLTPGRDYEKLYRAIKDQGSTWIHPLESVWIINTTKTTSEVKDALAKHVDSNDKLFVSVLEHGASWSNLANGFFDWMKKNPGA
ncbi:MAG TPA: hypothetical protein VFU12_15040 [Glycomyces sp.]|nr:hypothetical protein [Glycomyces sp.]